MKRILCFLVLLISLEGISQNPTNYIYRATRERLISSMYDSVLRVPRYSTTPTGFRVNENSSIDGAIAMDTTNNRLYIYSGGAWIRLANYTEASTGQRFGVTGEDTRATANRLFSFAGNRSMIWDSVYQFKIFGYNDPYFDWQGIDASNNVLDRFQMSGGELNFDGLDPITGDNINVSSTYSRHNVTISTTNGTLFLQNSKEAGYNNQLLQNQYTSGVGSRIRTGEFKSLMGNSASTDFYTHMTNSIVGSVYNLVKLDSTNGIVLQTKRLAGATYKGIKIDLDHQVFIDSVLDFSDTTNYKPLVINTTGTAGTIGHVKKATYWPGGGGGTNIYNSDGTLTGNRTLTGGSNNLTITGVPDFLVTTSNSGVLQSTNGSTITNYIASAIGGVGMVSSNTSGLYNEIEVASGVTIKPHTGNLKIDTLTAFTDTTDWKPMVYKTSTGDVRKATYWPGDGTGGGGGTVYPSNPGFRLTTESGVPISNSDRTGQSTIYYTPYLNNQITLYNGSAWVVLQSAQVSLALSGLTSGKNYDVFAYSNAGTLTLELSAAWTDDNTRADALAYQDGVLVKSGTTTRRYVGTIRTTGTTTTEDSGGGVTTQVGGKRFVWNMYNRVSRQMSVFDATDSWTYKTQTIRQANGASGNKVEYVTGDAGMMVDAAISAGAYLETNGSHAAVVGVGISSTSTFSGIRGTAYRADANIAFFNIASYYRGTPGLGYFYLSWNEYGADGTSCFFLGDNGGTVLQSGLTATIEN